MILRKPYAFLIKNFRLIHVILVILQSFIIYMTGSLYSFFKEYLISSKYLKIHIEPSITFVNWYIYLIVGIVVLILSFILVLMIRKDKPVKYYFCSVIFYILLLVVFFFASSQISALVRNDGTLQLVSAARDILQLFYFGQYAFIFLSVLRVIGFDIKSFNFQSDLKELNISEEDSEEFELDVELDSNDVKTKLRRNFRKVKYFILENKIILLPLMVVIGIFLIVYAILNVEIYNKIYKENETFKFKNLTLKVLNTYETTKDNYGNDISSGKYLYYVTEIQVKNETNENLSIDVGSIRLKIGDYDYYEVLSNETSNFSDLGTIYKNQVIKAGEVNKYILIFKVENQNKKSKKILELIKGASNQEIKHIRTELKPQNIDEVSTKNSANLKQDLKIENDFVNKVSIKIDEYKIAEVMEYNYKEVINNKSYTFTKIIQASDDDLYNKKVLRLKADIMSNSKDDIIDNFITTFGHIRYIKNKKEYDNPFKLVNITPKEEKEYVYLEVFSDVSSADEIYLDIIIRNDKYVYKLK